ncbi:hypothetical protein CKY51_15715 [Xanthomonas maliensis]|nr:hypothetical protein CKY51_15715 [Xanthomonas maliensis]
MRRLWLLPGSCGASALLDATADDPDADRLTPNALVRHRHGARCCSRQHSHASAWRGGIGDNAGLAAHRHASRTGPRTA